MSFLPEAISAEQTYRTEGGKLLYVHDVNGQKVIYCERGSIERHECSLRRFASRIVSEVHNQ